MEFGIEKRTILIMNSGKMVRIEQPNQERIRREGKPQVQVNIGSEHNQTSGYGRKIRKECLRRTRKLLKTWLNS